jgi:hypothetical protein
MADDGEFWCALAVALGGESGSERVSGEQPVEATSAGTTLDHVGNCSIR